MKKLRLYNCKTIFDLADVIVSDLSRIGGLLTSRNLIRGERRNSLSKTTCFLLASDFLLELIFSQKVQTFARTAIFLESLHKQRAFSIESI